MNQKWESSTKKNVGFYLRTNYFELRAFATRRDLQLNQQKEMETDSEKGFYYYLQNIHMLIRKYWLKRTHTALTASTRIVRETHHPPTGFFFFLAAVSCFVWVELIKDQYEKFQSFCVRACFVCIYRDKSREKWENNSSSSNNIERNFQCTRQSFEFIIIDNLIDSFNQMAMWKKKVVAAAASFIDPFLFAYPFFRINVHVRARAHSRTHICSRSQCSHTHN